MIAARRSSYCFPPPELYLPRPVTSANQLSNNSADADLLAQTARGDAVAFSQLYDRHSTLLFSFVVRILRDEHDAEDVLQDAFTTIWEQAARYDVALGRPLGWMITLTRNKALDWLRKRKRSAELAVESAEAAGIEMFIEDESATRMATDDAVLVRQAMSALSPAQRRSIELAFFGGLTHSEIAEQLGEPAGTIKARIRRGMLTMRDILEGQL